ncbi:MAG: hypothetical protein ACYTHJ_09165 [Planctomycetota bacterium]|jgi:hypothetical protein
MWKNLFAAVPALALVAALSITTTDAYAGDQARNLSAPYSMSLSVASLQEEQEEAEEEVEEETTEESTTETTTETSLNKHRHIDDFFNVREAFSDLEAGQFSFEFGMGWTTGGLGGDDDFGLWQRLAYGITDKTYVQISVLPLNLGDGSGEGNGELGFTFYTQCWDETDVLPAFAFSSDLRIPSGEGSEKVDAAFNFHLTKTILPQLRANLNAFVMTANGRRGDPPISSRGDLAELDLDQGTLYDLFRLRINNDEYDRRHFQWGTGFGLDYLFSDATVGTLNYLMRSNDHYGHANDHILELGVAHELSESQRLKFAIDIGLDGRDENENFGAKLAWEIDF